MIDFAAPGANILVADDNERNIRVFQEMLEPLGMQIDTATNGREALHRVYEKQYHIVFMDYRMPIMDGIEATAMIRSLTKWGKELPIIALSDRASQTKGSVFLEQGMDDVLQKPFQLEELLDLVRKYLPKELQKDAEYAAGLGLWHDAEILESLMGDYYRLIEEKAEKIRSYFQQGQWKDFTVEVHGMKNSSRMIGATELADQFFLLERLGKAEEAEEIAKALPEILELFLQYKQKLEQYA